MDQLVGVQPESAYREAIDRYRTSPDELIMEQVTCLAAWSPATGGRTAARGAEAKSRTTSELKVALADKLLQLDRGEDARAVESLPAEERDRQPASGLLARLRFCRS